MHQNCLVRVRILVLSPRTWTEMSRHLIEKSKFISINVGFMLTNVECSNGSLWLASRLAQLYPCCHPLLLLDMKVSSHTSDVNVI